MKTWTAKNWLESEIECHMGGYGNTREEAIEFITELLAGDEYRDALTDEQTAQVRRLLDTMKK